LIVVDLAFGNGSAPEEGTAAFQVFASSHRPEFVRKVEFGALDS
jgi:hypothetical protein